MSNSGQRFEYSSTIWRELLRGQRKARLLSILQGLSPDQASAMVSYTEGHLLYLLVSTPEQNVKDLAESLRLERSWVSRITTALEQKRIIKSFVPESDKRSKKISLSAKGKDIIKQLNTLRSSITEKRMSGLSASEQESLARYLNLLANGLFAPELDAEQTGHPIDAELIRVSWRIGTVGRSFMRSQFNLTQYQLIFCLNSAVSEKLSASDLYKQLPFDLSTITRTINSLVKLGYLNKEQDPDDKRSYVVRLTREGTNEWRRVQRYAAQVVNEALEKLSITQLDEFAELLTKSNISMPTRDAPFGAREFVIQAAQEQDRRALKQKIKKEKIQLEDELYSAKQGDSIKALVEIARDPATGAVSKIVFSGAPISESECLELIKNCCKFGK